MANANAATASVKDARAIRALVAAKKVRFYREIRDRTWEPFVSQRGVVVQTANAAPTANAAQAVPVERKKETQSMNRMLRSFSAVSAFV